MFDNISFSKRLRQKRILEMGVSLRDIAPKLGVSIATISRLEKGRTPDILSYAAACEWLGVPLNKFIKKAKSK